MDIVENGDRLFESVPLVLGVTGHRDLVPEDLPQLARLAGDFLDDLRRRYPNTPLMLLSPLAEGADRLLARVALEHDVRLMVPLPMERALYVQDFTTPESRQEFDELLGRAERWYELPVLPGISRQQIALPGGERNLQYQAVGFHIARKSQILVAIMEEMTSDSQAPLGGTMQIVQSRLGKITDPGAHEMAAPEMAASAAGGETHLSAEPVLFLEDAGPVYQIMARRQKNLPASDRFQPKAFWLYPEPERNESESEQRSRFVGAWERLDEFNKDAAAIREDGNADLAASRDGLLPEKHAAKLSLEFKRIRQAQAIADILASSRQKTATRTIQVLFLLAYAAFACFTVFIYCILESPYLLLTYPTLIGLAYLCYPPDTIRRWFWGVYRHCGWLSAHNKYLDYRALAEGLRVQFYWYLAGLPDNVASHYFHKQKADVDWIREALNNLHLTRLHAGCASPPPVDGDHLGLVRETWVRGQAEWFERKAREQGPKLEAAATRARILIALGILASVALGFVLLFIPDFKEWVVPGTEISLIDMMHALLELAAVAGAFWLEYREKLYCDEQVKRYEKMASLYTRADQHLALYLSHARHHRSRSLLRELGKAALDESADWLMLHRQNPPEVQT